VLCGLIDAGFTEFRRVGSLKKIAKVLLPWVATTSGQKGRGGDGEIENALRELRAMLSEPLQPKERAAVQQTLNELISDTGAGGKSSGRMAQLQQQAVIGTTCQSANKSVLDALCGDGRPAIVLMDECSQMLEPMSLVALARFRAARLVAVSRAFPSCTRSILTEIYLCHACSHHEIVDGNARPGGRPAAAATHTRLAVAGVRCITLRTQYRCHPKIARIANELFYGGQLLDAPGLQARQTPILLRRRARHLPAAASGVDMHGASIRAAGRRRLAGPSACVCRAVARHVHRHRQRGGSGLHRAPTAGRQLHQRGLLRC
jgi:hypothetical protein